VRDTATCPNCCGAVTVTCNRPYRFAIDPPFDSPVEGAWVIKAVIDRPGEIIDEFKVSAAGYTIDFIAARSGRPLGAWPSYEVHHCPDRPGVGGGDSASVPAKPSSSPPTREGSAAVDTPSPQTP
jgi:hypothetical protein